MGWIVLLLSVLPAMAVLCGIAFLYQNTKKARRYAVTLKNNEGAFIGLCVKRRWDYWTFVDVKIVPTNPGAAVAQAAPGELYVPYRNMLYYQEIANVAE